MWWRDGVLYQVYPRSFADSNGDGIGDLRGILARLEYLSWLGVSGIWLNPTMPSPNADWGYDVADYCAVHPDLGTLEDLDALIAAAGERGMRVLLDLVPNHTSDRHPWFTERPDFYVWADARADGSPPNNWLSAFGGSAWEWDESRGRFYLHNFLPEQPDLDWWNDGVRDAFDEILRFWYSRGVAGFRIDVAHAIVKDKLLRDDPAPTADDHPIVQRQKLRHVYSMNRPEVHDVLRRWRRLSDGCDPQRILVGETYVLDLASLLPFYGQGDELNLAFNFPFIHSPLDADALRTIVEGVEAGIPEGCWPVYTGSNHDAGRLMTRWAGDDERRARAALLMLLTLRGAAFLYYGDEIALEEVPIDAGSALDPVARRTGDPSRNRDVCRTPMPWDGSPGAGFTADGATRPWLPIGDNRARNVADQRDDPGSTLHLVRDLIALRRSREDLTGGAYATLDAPAGAWAYRRGEGTVVALNLSDAAAVLGGVSGRILIATDRPRDGEDVAGALELGAWQAAVLDAS